MSGLILSCFCFAVVYGILTGESHSHLDRSEVTRFLLETDGPNLPSSLSLLFSEGDKVNFEQFSAWLEKHNEVRLQSLCLIVFCPQSTAAGSEY